MSASRVYLPHEHRVVEQVALPMENKDKEGAAVDEPEPTQFVRLAPGARRSWQTA